MNEPSFISTGLLPRCRSCEDTSVAGMQTALAAHKLMRVVRAAGTPDKSCGIPTLPAAFLQILHIRPHCGADLPGGGKVARNGSL
jgi:hypothetical protein